MGDVTISPAALRPNVGNIVNVDVHVCVDVSRNLVFKGDGPTDQWTDRHSYRALSMK